jgi:DUF971 family protein
MVAPVDIAHARRRNLLVVTWEDGVVSEFPVPYLRGWCPCAVCQGHGIEVEFHEAPDEVSIEGLYEMGAYALGIRFSDGHDAGIYSWSWLRRIAPETEPRGFKKGLFRGGTYAAPR